eukprot:m.446439 g.446439  ORF g.446439 m.446439 type:complete len:370 (+) comp20311_c0_seq1:215-1324(+)
MAPGNMDFTVKYRGFVHADTNVADIRPGTDEVNAAAKMLSKKNLKKTRGIHPLFGRGMDTPLTLTISTAGLCVSSAEKKETILNTSMHKIAFAASSDKALGVILKRPGVGRFKCHLFAFDSAAKAAEAGQHLKKTVNFVFQQLKRVKAVLETKQPEGPPVLAPRPAQLPDEEQPWYHGPLTRSDADGLLLSGVVVNGLFLVRQSPSCATDYAIDFCYNGKTYHNRVRKQPSGEFENSKGTKFPSLTALINNYQSPQADMQTMLTEYIPNEPTSSGPGGVVYENVALLRNPGLAKQGSAWRLEDIQSAVAEIEKSNAEEVAADEITFDPIYDDNRFGFGDEFVATALGIILAKELDTVDGEAFDLGDVDC